MTAPSGPSSNPTSDKVASHASPSASPSRIPALDGVRALAALGVLIFHFWQGGLFGAARIASLAVIGQTGVDLFFVLSGFLITRILLAARYANESLGPFFIRRCARILPLYYLGLVIYVFILPWVMEHGPTANQLRGSAWWWIYLQGVPLTAPHLESFGPNHYWSLGVEEHFYLLWPLIVFWSSPRALIRISVGVILSAIIFRTLFIYQLGWGTFYATPCRVDGLGCGALLACLERERIRLTWWDQARRLAGFLVLGAGSILMVCWLAFSRSGSPALGVFKFTGINLFYLACLFYLLSRESKQPNWILRTLECRPLRAIGSCSYGIYVYHPAIITLVGLFSHPQNRLQNAGIVIVSTLALSWASFRFVESPILRLTRRDD